VQKILRMNDDPNDLPLFSSTSTPIPTRTRVADSEAATLQ
jgi:hypothetical protein